MDIKKLKKEFDEKLHKACEFGTTYIMKDLRSVKNYNFDNEFKEETFRCKTNLKEIENSLNLGLSMAFSYMVTPDEMLKEEKVENYGKDLDKKGLDEFDDMFNQIIIQSIDNGYESTILNLIKQGSVTYFDYGTKDIYEHIKYCLAELSYKLPEMLEIKKNNFRETIPCPKCKSVYVYKDDMICNGCGK